MGSKRIIKTISMSQSLLDRWTEAAAAKGVTPHGFAITALRKAIEEVERENGVTYPEEEDKP